MMPVPAPLEHVAVHVVEAPGVCRVTPDRGRPLQGGPLRGPVVRLPLEVRLLTAQLVAEAGGGRGARPAGVLPLGFLGETELPPLRQLAGGPGLPGQLTAELLRFLEVHRIDREIV